MLDLQVVHAVLLCISLLRFDQTQSPSSSRQFAANAYKPELFCRCLTFRAQWAQHIIYNTQVYPLTWNARSPCHLDPTPETQLWRLVLCMAGGVLKGRGTKASQGDGMSQCTWCYKRQSDKAKHWDIEYHQQVQMTFQRYPFLLLGNLILCLNMSKD